MRNNEFDHENLQLGINEAHALGKQFYVVANIQPHNSKLKTFIRDMRPVVEMKPDALIMSDPGLIMMMREAFRTCLFTCRYRPTRSTGPR